MYMICIWDVGVIAVYRVVPPLDRTRQRPQVQVPGIPRPMITLLHVWVSNDAKRFIVTRLLFVSQL